MFLLLPAPIPTGPKRCVNREMDLGSHISELDSLLLQSFLTVGSLDTVFVTLCKQGDGAGLSGSVLDSLLLQSFFLTAGTLDTVFVTLCVGERGGE